MKTVACPRCRAPTPYSPQNSWRPFCSERCKVIDLGAWATESYRAPAEGGQQGPEDEASSKPRGS